MKTPKTTPNPKNPARPEKRDLGPGDFYVRTAYIGIEAVQAYGAVLDGATGCRNPFGIRCVLVREWAEECGLERERHHYSRVYDRLISRAEWKKATGEKVPA